MDAAYVKACLNLHAVLPNLEELVVHDPESARLSKNWDIRIQFLARNGPTAWVAFDRGCCTVNRGKHVKPDVKLFFTSPGHLNRMMDGKANPIPVKGFTRLGFLSKQFPKLTDRLEAILKAGEEQLRDPVVLDLNTRMTLYTAACAAREIIREPRGLTPSIKRGSCRVAETKETIYSEILLSIITD